MKLCGFLIVVKDINKAKQYYHDLFGLEMKVDNDGNMILSGGLVLQEEKYWRGFIGKDILPQNNACELYFEEENVDLFYEKLKALYPQTEFVNLPFNHSWGQRVVRFYDPDGNLIEVGTPIKADEAGEEKEIMIETKRLKIYPASEEQMKTFIAEQPVVELKAAYSEMLNGALAHPEQWAFHAIWMIELKGGTHTGELCFKGIDESGSTEIGYGIAEDYRGNGFAAEAVTAAADWALNQNAVNCVTAEVKKDNFASIKVLEKSGFKPTGRTGEEGEIFIKTK